MRRWQFDLLFGIAVAGVILLPLLSAFDITIAPETLPSFGAVLAFVLTQRKEWTNGDKPGKGKKDKEND